MKTAKLFLCAIFLISSTGNAQQNPAPPPVGGANNKNSAINGPRKHMATILFAGLGGAVLGLSTLSFYGRPQDKLNNIAIGFAIGVMFGTVYITYKAVTTPTEFYGFQLPDRPNFEKLGVESTLAKAEPTTLGFNWSF